MSVDTARPSPTADAGADRPRAASRSCREGARAERRLGWLLCAPAVIIMVAVTAYPIGYSVYLSLQRYDLRFPDQAKFIGLENYVSVLTSPYWWDAFWNTVIITVVSVAIELVLGMALAIVMHRTIFGRGSVRTSILIPYGIVTVVAAFSWQYAWTPEHRLPVGALRRRRPAHRPLAGHRRHHPGRGLEDHAVHGAAADGRAGPGARGPAEGGQGRRRHGVAAVHARSRCR